MTVKIPGCDIKKSSVYSFKLYDASRKRVSVRKAGAVFRTARRCPATPAGQSPYNSDRLCGRRLKRRSGTYDRCLPERLMHVHNEMRQPTEYTRQSSSRHRNACIFFKKTYSPTSRLACLPQKRATRCCCGKFLLELRHAAEIFRGGEPAPQPKDFHDQRPRNPSDRDPEFRRTEPEAFQTQDPHLCPRKDGYCL